MKSLFEFNDYKQFVQSWVENQPKKGRGAYRRIAEELRLSAVLVSQIFRGDRHLSLEAAADLAEKVLTLSEIEQRYFMLLVSRDRAGSAMLAKHYEAQLEELRARARRLDQHLKKDIVLSDAAKARFHSDWAYSAIRLATSVPGLNSAQAIAAALRLPVKQVHEALEFLLSNGLIKEEGGGYAFGPSTTMLESTSPYVWARQVAWRTKGFQEMRRDDASKFFYTGGLALSEKDLEWLRASLVKLVADVVERVKDSPSETVVGWNVDLFRVITATSHDPGRRDLQKS